ncbi:YfbU family protein [Cronobacter dublinensis]|nr:YfbU family protein [Cronobacter dublinensis]
MKLTDAEKVSLTLLTEIHRSLKLYEEGIDSTLISNAIDTGNEWAITWKYGSYLGFNDREIPDEVKEVSNILEMWSFIEEGVAALDASERQILEEKAAPYGRNPVFSGFDGNNEARSQSIASFLSNELGVYERFAGRSFYSPSSRMPIYQRMYVIFEAWLKNYPDRNLNLDELVKILNARQPQ